MTRQEFLEELRIALQGELGQRRINEHLQYYDTYIMEEARKGRTEQQVIDELGSPRLIARTLIDAAKARGEEQSYGEQSYEEPNDFNKTRGFKLNSWYGKLLMILAAILIIIVIANVVAFLLPIVIPVILVLLVLSLIFGNRR